jgi:hypothetical protein
MPKLLRIVKSPKPEKKWRAVFLMDTGREKKTDFGAAGMQDYTLTHDKEQRERYRARHKKDLETGDPTRAGILSYYVLWGNSVSMQKNISDFKKKFAL